LLWHAFSIEMARKRYTWQFHANTIRFASAMGGAGDYGVYAGGRYQLPQALREMNDWLNLRKKFDTSVKK